VKDLVQKERGSLQESKETADEKEQKQQPVVQVAEVLKFIVDQVHSSIAIHHKMHSK
jgi:hypothetical protein